MHSVFLVSILNPADLKYLTDYIHFSNRVNTHTFNGVHFFLQVATIAQNYFQLQVF